MNIKDDNRGLSLLELLVAVAILAVIVIPFLFAFLTSTRINTNTKEQQKAKYAATNVMEDIRSRSVESVISDSNTTYNEDDKTYLYTTEQESDGSRYTVEATLDPNYDAESDKDEATDYNATDIAQIYGMNSAYDGFFEVDAAQDMSKIEQLAELRLKDIESIGQQIYISLTREIVVKISSNEAGGTDVVVQTTYNDPIGNKVNTVSTSEQTIYSDSTNKADLRGVYLFYNPLYNGSKRISKETVTVVNEKGAPCTIYIIKQQWPGKVEDNSDISKFMDWCSYKTDNTRDENYLVNVRLSEPNRNDSSLISGDMVNVVTNIRTNIDDPTKYEKFSSDRVDGHLKLTYGNNGGNYAFTKSLNGNVYPASRLMGLKDLAGSTEGNSVYHVVVKAYKGIGEDKESEPVFTLKSTTS